MRATATATVTAPVSQVWAALADHEAMASWGPGMKVTMAKLGADEPNGVGAVRSIKAPGPAPAIVEEIVRFEPDHALGYRALSGVPFRDYSGEVVLTAVGGGTRIEWTLNADQRIPLVEAVALKTVSVTLLQLFVRAVKRG
ncbi:SRPBCC family protein [Nocardioides caeni]|uniref:SRPBCC family protein n=1 Tax=Nocardioides caeni TaxID=574700 RepID=A0A4S8NH03_9ACTN|nr:SRPBCC family protein [Nocardioides caeni]THV16040.1 SRPBCC family protein [Nocardioides caeni]